MTAHDAAGTASPRTPGRPWLRAAGWLILLPPLFFVRQMALVLDRSLRMDGLRTFMEASFGFWRDELPFEYRLRALVNLGLLLVAIAVGVVTVIGGVGRIAALLVSAAQALVCPVGILWDHAGLRSFPPESVRRLPLPVPGGRVTSAFYLLLAVAAFVLALVDRTPKLPSSARSHAPPQWSPPTSTEASAPSASGSTEWSPPAQPH